MSTTRKVQIFEACVLSSLSCGLRTAHVGVVARRRIDGFHARSLCKILGVAHAYYSMVSNVEVFQKANQRPFSEMLLEHQKVFVGNIACGSSGPIRFSTFFPGILDSVDSSIERRRGRPRQTWTSELSKLALAVAGSRDRLIYMLLGDASLARWRSVVQAHCRRQVC